MSLYKRRKTREVYVGNVIIGGSSRIRIQSMTNTDSLDTESTVSQILNLKNAGCEMVRLTIPTLKSAYNLKCISEELVEKKVKIPLIADIHYNFEAAMIAADYVQKIRINPGNFAEDNIIGNKNKTNDIKRIALKISPFIEKIKNKNVALRIGVNHGSLSARILEKYGNTIKGMVASAIEYLEVCKQLNFFNIVLSLKSSIPSVMIEAYRELVRNIDKNNFNYPLHLGVTEAGEGTIARIKSSIGITTLLMEGLGDTIRVSLTEPPENEIPVGKAIVKKIQHLSSNNYNPKYSNFILKKRVMQDLQFPSNIYSLPLLGLFINKKNYPKDNQELGYFNDTKNKKSLLALDFILSQSFDYLKYINIPSELVLLSLKKIKRNCFNLKNVFFHVIDIDKLDFKNYPKDKFFLRIDLSNLKSLNLIKLIPANSILLLKASNSIFYLSIATFLNFFKKMGLKNEVFIHYQCNFNLDQMIVNASSDIGAVLLNYKVTGILFENNKISVNEQREFLFNVLQSIRMRMTQADFIACPTCGRTNYDLFNALKNIKKATSHLVGVKIGVMGCIVNGPGEMADADYGCVGSRRGTVTLFRGRNIVVKDIPEEEAVDKLIQIIKTDGKWIDKS